MQLDWTTFILEILNFLVLVWILQRFLYRPVLDLLAARRQKIQDSEAQAELLRSEAEALRRQYESRLADWQKECENSRRDLQEELAQLKTQELDKLKSALALETEKQNARNEKLLAAREAALLGSAIDRAYGDAARMLNRLASPGLTERIAGVFLEDLAALPNAERAQLSAAADALEKDAAITIVSAHPLTANLRDTLLAALCTAGGKPLQADFAEDARLIAGLRAVVGECELNANLSDELKFFRRQANHVR